MRKSTSFLRLTYPLALARIVYHVGRPAMFDGNMFLLDTGTPIWKIDRSSTMLAVWLPDPLMVAIWMANSLTMRSVREGETDSRTATSVTDIEFYPAPRLILILAEEIANE